MFGSIDFFEYLVVKCGRRIVDLRNENFCGLVWKYIDFFSVILVGKSLVKMVFLLSGVDVSE